MRGVHWLCLAIGVAIGYFVVPMVLSLFTGQKGG